MRKSDEDIKNSVRISFSKYTTVDEIDELVERIVKIVKMK
jgi:cysteine sulfinate desulfinase/cysteine desulfurase-like protein